MTDQNNAPECSKAADGDWPAVLRLRDHYMDEIVGWMQADDKASDCMTYIRADRAAPEGQVLPKPSPGNETWTVCPDYLVELRDQAGEWAEQTSLEAVEAILLAFVKSSALTPPPAAQEPVAQRCAECDCENGGKDCNWIAPPPAYQQEAVTVAEAAAVLMDSVQREGGTGQVYQAFDDAGCEWDDVFAALRALKGGA